VPVRPVQPAYFVLARQLCGRAYGGATEKQRVERNPSCEIVSCRADIVQKFVVGLDDASSLTEANAEHVRRINGIEATRGDSFFRGVLAHHKAHAAASTADDVTARRDDAT
jgi:hypothetical protein